MPLSATTASRLERVTAQFDLFNDREFDRLLQRYRDDVRFATNLLPEFSGDWGSGKALYKQCLATFRDRYGRLSVLDAFGETDRSNVLVEMEAGGRAMFCTELDAHLRIRQVFVYGV